MADLKTQLDTAPKLVVTKSPKIAYNARASEREFDVYTPDGNIKLAAAKEQYDCCCRSCLCFYRREFDLSMTDGSGKEHYKIRKTGICCPMCPCTKFCQHRLILFADSRSGDSEIGFAASQRHVCGGVPQFMVWDSQQQPKFRMERDVNCCGHCCPWCYGPRCGCRPSSAYKIKEAATDAVVGQIQRVKLIKFDKQKTYSITMPPNAHPDTRALILASSFLMNYTLMEEGPQEEQMERDEVGLPPADKDLTPDQIDGIKPREDD